LLETVNRAKILNNLFFENSIVEFAAILRCRREVLPEKGMINVTCSVERVSKRVGSKRDREARTTTIELQSTLKCDFLFGVLGFSICLFCGIEAVDVSLMMLGMMEFHDFFADVRF